MVKSTLALRYKTINSRSSDYDRFHDSRDMSPNFLRTGVSDETRQELGNKPWPYHVADRTSNCERDEERCCRDIRPAQKGVLTANPRYRRDDNGLRATVRLHGVV